MLVWYGMLLTTLFEAGLTSSDVIEKITNETTMSAGTVSSQLTYWRKATSKQLAKRASTAKAEKDAEKAENKAKRDADRAAKREQKEQEKAVKAKEKLAKLQAEADKLKAATEQTSEQATTEA